MRASLCALKREGLLRKAAVFAKKEKLDVLVEKTCANSLRVPFVEKIVPEAKYIFIVRDGEVWTSSGDYCLDGITRRNVINVCKANGIPVYEKNFSLMQVYGADEAFVTGTFAGLTPVFEVDGRTMTHTRRGPMVDRLQALYKELVVSESALPENCSS